MDVGVGVLRHVEVDDVAQFLDVDAAGDDVGGHENPRLARLESLQRRRPLALAAIAVDLRDRDALALEVVRQPVRAVLGPREDDGVGDDVALHQFGQQRRLQFPAHRVDGLCDADGRRRLPLEVDGDRLPEHLVRERGDFPRHGGAEEQRLALRGQLPQHAADVGQEAHVEHAVGLVEHEDLEPGEARVGEAQMIEEAAGRGDDHVDAAAERVLLRAHPHAAVHRRARDRGVHGEFLEVRQDLGGQLARRRQDERPRRAARLVHHPVEDGQQERGGLAAAGHRAGQQVLAGGGGRDRLVLDRRRALKTQFLDAAEEVGMKRELREWHASSILACAACACAILGRL